MGDLSYWTCENWMELAIFAKNEYESNPPQPTDESRLEFLKRIAQHALDRGFSLRVLNRAHGMHGLIRNAAPDDDKLLGMTYGDSERWLTPKVHGKRVKANG
jgi:hypothetical protein